MGIKKRIKRALAAFLKDELMDYIGYNHNIPAMSLGDRFRVDSFDFETIVMEELLDMHPRGMNGFSDPMILEEHIQRCKDRFSKEIIRHIHVEAENLTSREHYMRRSVRLVLRVQKIK